MVFIHIDLLPYVIGIAFITLAVLIFWETRKKQNPRLYFRLAALLFAIISLALLALEPAFLENKKTQTAILLTKNYSPRVLDSLNEVLTEPLVLEYTGLDQKKEIPIVHDLFFLERNYPEISQLYVIGDGIPVYDIKLLNEVELHFLLNPLQEGVLSLQIPDKIIAHSIFELSGTIQNNQKEGKWIVLADPGGNRDSALIEGLGEQDFKIRMKAGNEGNYLYQLILKNKDNQLIQSEKIPLAIQPLYKPRIWILNSTPEFESKYLKNFLGDTGYEVAVRSFISKGKVKDEWVNQGKSQIQLDGDLAKKTDILLMDNEYWSLLSGSEQNAIQYAVAEEGLGVMIFANENTLQNKNPLLQNFNLTASQEDTLDFSAAEYGEKEKFNLSKTALSIIPDWNTVSMLTDGKNTPVIVYKSKGMGKIAVNILKNTYPMVLSGRKELYKILWATIFNKLSPQIKAKQIWKHQKLFAFVDEPFPFTLQSDERLPVGVVSSPSGGKEEFYFRQNNQINEFWEGIFRAKQKGWHSLYVKPDTTNNPYPLYVFESSEWQGMQRKNQLEVHKKWIENGNSVKSTMGTGDYKNIIPISLLWFYIIFLMSAGFLWLEEKLF